MNSHEKKEIVDSEIKEDGIENNLVDPSDDMSSTTSTNELSETRTSVSSLIGADER